MKNKTRNINVTIDEDTYWKLKENANKRKLDFHDYIRLIYQEV